MTTKIEWTKNPDGTKGEVWNPVRGCRKVSAGCANCYAEKMASRFSGPGQPYEGLTSGGKWTGRARFVPEMLDKPLRWRKPRRVFVNSMSDLFHDDITDEQIAAAFGIMAACPQHCFQVLTKRPQRMLAWFARLEGLPFAQPYACARAAQPHVNAALLDRALDPWPLPNVHLGVSCEGQLAANERIPLLLQTPAAIRWVSCEPLLWPVDFTDISSDGIGRSALHVDTWNVPNLGVRERHLDWVVVGSESGHNARPMDLDWVRQIRDDCVEAGVPLFFKQRHENGVKISVPELDGRVWDQYPNVKGETNG